MPEAGAERAESAGDPPRVFADDSQVIDYQHKPHFTPNLQTRLDTALETFWHALHRRDIQAPAFGQPQGVAHV